MLAYVLCFSLGTQWYYSHFVMSQAYGSLKIFFKGRNVPESSCPPSPGILILIFHGILIFHARVELLCISVGL